MLNGTFDEISAQFLNHKLQVLNQSRRTIELYALGLRRLGQFCREIECDPLDLGTEQLRVWAGAWLHKRHRLAPQSRCTHVAACREFYRWAHERRLIETNPARDLEYPQVGRRLPRVMTLANAEKLMWAPDFSTFEGVRDGAILAILVGCGLRAGGLVRLNQGDVVAEMVDGKPRLQLRVVEKGDRMRLVPVPPEADILLRVYLEHPELQAIDRSLPDGEQVLFVSTRNRAVAAHEYVGERRRFNRRAILEMVKRYGIRQGIPDDQLHPHALRHLYGTELAEDDVDLATRQLLLGHADPKSTEIYTHLSRRKLTREADRANPLAKISTPVSEMLRRLK